MVRKFSLSAALGAMAVSTLGALGSDAADVGGGRTDWAMSANWEIMEWTDPLTVSVDTASISTRAARTTARVMWDYTELQNTRDQTAAPFKSMIGIIVFDCAGERFGGAGSVSYSGGGGDGTPVAQYAINPDNATLSASQPGTLGHDLLTYVCAHAQQGGTDRHAAVAGKASEHSYSSAKTRPGS
jgi:hypothetical protein